MMDMNWVRAHQEKLEEILICVLIVVLVGAFFFLWLLY